MTFNRMTLSSGKQWNDAHHYIAQQNDTQQNNIKNDDIQQNDLQQCSRMTLIKGGYSFKNTSFSS